MNEQRTKELLIEDLALLPHPEGGWYRETFRSEGNIPAPALPQHFAGPRSYVTSILYLLDAAGFSSFHSLASDEIWYFHLGSPVTIHLLHRDEGYRRLQLGSGKGCSFQAIIPSGTWFAAESADWTLVGCAVAPGFDFADFVIGSRAELLQIFPDQAPLVTRLTRG